jgi:hypothetical protein
MGQILHKIDTEKLSDDTEFEHDWEIGLWKRNGRYKYETRHDICTLCGCERHSVKSIHTNEKEYVSGYWRGKNYFGHDNEPTCWGSLNP